MTQGLHFLTEGEGRREDSDHTASQFFLCEAGRRKDALTSMDQRGVTPYSLISISCVL